MPGTTAVPALRLYARHNGSASAHETPCAIGVGDSWAKQYASEWPMMTPALSDMPARCDAHSMVALASRSPFTAGSIHLVTMPIAAVAHRSDIGDRSVDSSDSVACDNASMPVSASTAGGRKSSSDGSSTAASGTYSGLADARLCPSTVTMAYGVTSDPVPHVVGINTSGGRATGHVVGPTASAELPVLRVRNAINLAASRTEPPPTPTTTSALAERAIATRRSTSTESGSGPDTAPNTTS
nr:hypothetical protein [Thermocrispum municipale]